jgi:hypothetical protein
MMAAGQQLSLPLGVSPNPLQPFLGPSRFKAGSRVLTVSECFDTYWRFAAERQRIFHGRASGTPPPWTGDPILRQYKFTSVYRAADRVSQYLITDVIYAGPKTRMRCCSASCCSSSSTRSRPGTCSPGT